VAFSFHILLFLFQSTTFSILPHALCRSCTLSSKNRARNNHHLSGHHLLQPARLTEISIPPLHAIDGDVCFTISERQNYLCVRMVAREDPSSLFTNDYIVGGGQIWRTFGLVLTRTEIEFHFTIASSNIFGLTGKV
jgi:hypothetical protein